MNGRRFSRVPFRVAVTVVAGTHVLLGRIENLSMNGMFLETSVRLPEGTTADITLELAGTEPSTRVALTGRICRVEDRGLGFQFDHGDVGSFTHLRSIVSFNSADPDLIATELSRHLADRKPGTVSGE